MLEVTIFSAGAARANDAEPGAYPTTTWTGLVQDPAPEALFRAFNRVDDSDVVRLRDIGYRLPSLSVGDLLRVGGNVWRVAGTGFKDMGSDTCDECGAMLAEPGLWHERSCSAYVVTWDVV